MRLWKTALLAFLVLLPGWTNAASNLALSSLLQQGKHHELIRELQPEVDSGKDVSSFQLMMLGGAYYEVRRYNNALAVADLMAKRISAGDSSYFGADLSVYPQIIRAAVNLDQGVYEQAIRHATEAYGRLKQSQFFYRSQLVLINNILGVANALLGRADAARNSLEAIRKVDLTMSNLGPEKFIAMARIHMALKEYDKALAAVNDRDADVSPLLTMFYDPTFQNLPRHFIRLKSLFETGRTSEAKQGYDQLLKHPQIAQFGGIYWLVLYDRARIALAEGDRATAIELLRRAVEIIELQRSSIDSETGRIGFVGDKQSVYQMLVSLLVADGSDTAAFEYVERSKARALVDLLASQKSVKVEARNPDAGNTLLKLSQAEADLVALPAPGEREGGARSRSAVSVLRSQLQTQAPELASLVTVTSTPPNVIQALLMPDEALLEYYYTGQELLVFVMTGDAVRAARLERAGLEESVIAFRASLANPATNDYLGQSRALYERLFKPVAGMLRAGKLVVVPHGVLHYLPFNALRSDKSFLIDDYSIRVEPSASVLKLMEGREKRPVSSALLLGNPDLGRPEFDLKFAQEEATAIARLMPEARILVRGEATRSFVRAQAERYTVIHFATHGLFDLKEPLNSALLLAPDQESDGRLTVGDLYTLKLDATLVTLSACETALGKVANGDDVVGFTRGLLYAGASSIVSSLWNVDDLATRDLMVDFYANLPKLGKQEALRQAQLGVRTRRDHPFFWAAFILTGNAQ